MKKSHKDDNAESLAEILEEAARESAKELRDFLRSPRGGQARDSRRVSVALGAVTSYTRWRASQNNLIGMMLATAKIANLNKDRIMIAAKAAGLLPEDIDK